MNYTEVKSDVKSRMEGAIKSLDNEFRGLRTGRASTAFLDPVQIEAYGSRMPINQLATVSTPDAKTIYVQVWDKAMLKTVEKAIAEANLGVSTISDNQGIRINMPIITEERRKDLVKLAHKYAENTKVSIRNVRRDGIDKLKKMEKDKLISEDEMRKYSDEIQKVTDEFTSKIDVELKNKEQEIMKL
jgi:ribosome recycling factor